MIAFSIMLLLKKMLKNNKFCAHYMCGNPEKLFLDNHFKVCLVYPLG